MLELLQDANNSTFYWCIAIILVIGAMELIGAVLGGTISTAIDGALDWDFDFDVPDSPFSQALGWLMFGKLPFMMVLIVFLTCFSLIGLTIQQTIFTVYGSYFPQFVAGVLAFIGSIPAQHYFGGKIAKAMPKTESSAVREDTFVGKTAVITIGTAQVGKPAEARLTDEHGQQHYVMVEPVTDDQSFPRGSEVVLTDKVGNLFHAIKP